MTSSSSQNGSFMDRPCPLRPWPTASSDRRPKNFAEYVAQVNREYPGGFRAFRLADLKSNGGSAGGQQDEATAEAGEDEEGQVSRKDPGEARNEILKNIMDAHNSALLALDVVSLVLSKEHPTTATVTLRPELRDLVGIGTLGIQKHDDSNMTAEMIKDSKAIASGSKILAIDESRASAERAATMLKREVAKESRYWKDVLSVKEAGWSLCCMPRERQTLGVRFGFNEANSEFRSQSLAPMRRAKDGSVELDLGMLGGQAQRVFVTLEKDGKVTGMSSLTPPLHHGQTVPLPAQVLEARNTIFARELWHELQMESRNLLSYNVRQYRNSIVYRSERGLTMKVELLSLDQCPRREQPLPQDTLAEAIHIALHLLLSHTHRQNETLRARPAPPHQPRSRTQNQYHLLRPVIARLIHLDAIKESAKYFGNLVRCLRHARVADSKFELIQPPQSPTDLPNAGQRKGQMSASQAFINSMLTPQVSCIDLTVTPGNRISVIGQTWLMPATTTMYQVNLPPSHQPDAPNTIPETCPSYQNYPSLAELRQYINRAVACAITNVYHKHLDQAERVRGGMGGDEEGIQQELWQKSVLGTTICALGPVKRKITFEVAGADDSPELIVTTSTFPPDFDGKPDTARHVWNAQGTGADANSITLPNVCAELVKRGYRDP